MRAIRNGEDGNHRLRIGKVNENSAYTKVGLPAENIYMHRSILEKSLFKKHSDHVDENGMRKICELLRKPVLITKYVKNGVAQKNTVSVYTNYSGHDSPMVIGMIMKWDKKSGLWHEMIPTMHLHKNIEKAKENVLWIDPEIKKNPTKAPWLPAEILRYAASTDGVMNTIT